MSNETLPLSHIAMSARSDPSEYVYDPNGIIKGYVSADRHIVDLAKSPRYSELALALGLPADTAPKNIRRAMLGPNWLNLPSPSEQLFGPDTNIDRKICIEKILGTGSEMIWIQVDKKAGGHTPTTYKANDLDTHPPQGQPVRIMQRAAGPGKKPFRFSFDEDGDCISIESGPEGAGASEVWEPSKGSVIAKVGSNLQIQSFTPDSSELPNHVDSMVETLKSHIAIFRERLHDTPIKNPGLIAIEGYLQEQRGDWLFVDVDLPLFDVREMYASARSDKGQKIRDQEKGGIR